MNSTVLILRGILAFILGLILVIWPESSLGVILVLFPIFLMIDGLSAIIIGMRTAKEGRWLSFIPMGILEILLGFFVLIWPDITLTTFVFLMALWAFVLGLGEFFIAISDQKLSSISRWLYALAGIITFALGVCVMIYPLITSLVILWLFGIFFLAYGLLLFFTGLWVSARLSNSTK